MVFIVASLIILLVCSLILLLLEYRKRKRFQRLQKERGQKNLGYIRFYTAVFRSVHAYILLIDRDFNILRTNYYERTGKTDDGREKKVGDLLCCRNALLSGMCGTHENCKDCAVRKAITQAYQQRSSFFDLEVSLSLAVAPNKYIECEAQVSGSYMDVNGEKNMVITIHDITELLASKRKNEKLESIVNFTSSVSQVGFASWNMITGDELVTSAYCTNLGEGVGERAEVLMRNFAHVYQEDREDLLSFISSAEKSQAGPLQKEIRIMAGEDSLKWVKIFLMQKEYAPEQGTNEIYSLSLDIDKQKRNEEALANEKEKAEDADKSKSVFLANMSHEIRTPLNSIIGFSELLADANTPEEKSQYLHILKSNNEMLLQLVNDILDVAKIEAGTLEFTYWDVDINLLLTEMQQLFEVKIEHRDQVQLIAELPLPELNLVTDRSRLMQVLFNFLSNAVKFTEAGTIRFGYKPCDKGYYFYVSDTGVGLTEEMAETVFERFSRFHKEKKGNGLGLSICKTIVEKLGGEIGVDSVPGEGATFWFIHPAKVNNTQEDAPKVGKKAPKAKEMITEFTATGKKYTILVAEDMDDNYQLCEAILSENYKLLRARNGEEAVTMYVLEQPDLILMDLKMPEVDGYQATEAIRQLSGTVPIIALTAFASSEDKDKVMQSGFTDILTKPISAGMLIDKVQAYCK